MIRKKPSIVNLALWAAFLLLPFAQAMGNSVRHNPVRLQLSDSHMVTLSFPSSVKYVDFGSADIKGGYTSHQNILHIKSSIPYFEETTASVVTADGDYYSFVLDYAPTPAALAVNMRNVSDIIRPSDLYTPFEVEVSDLKTSHFVCADKVTDILTGSDSIIAGYAENIENIVRCKAAATAFPQTTLTLITASGEVYPYLVTYNQTPALINYNVAREGEDGYKKAIFGDHSINETEMERFGKKVVSKGETINSVGAFSQEIIFAMSALYIKDDILMFRFDLENDSRIDYEVDFMKMYITDKKQGKKKAQQEDEIKPVYVYSESQDPYLIHGKSENSYVFFFRRFTIPKGRVLHIEAFEKNGGRHISFKISNSEILKARQID